MPAALERQDAAQAVAPRRLDAGELRRLCLDLLGRPPLAEERARWIGGVADEVVEALVASRAFWAQWLEEQLWYFLLVDQFAPRGEGVLRLPDELEAGELDARDAVHRIALAPNFDQRNPGADTFVTVVMEQLCGLEVAKQRRELELGKKMYEGAEARFLGGAGRSQSDVVKLAVESDEFGTTWRASTCASRTTLPSRASWRPGRAASPRSRASTPCWCASGWRERRWRSASRRGGRCRTARGCAPCMSISSDANPRATSWSRCAKRSTPWRIPRRCAA